MADNLLANFEKSCKEAIDHFGREASLLRASRPTPALVEDILIDYYGSKLPLKQLSSITVVLPNQIIIEPWDKNAAPLIDKAVSMALNLTARIDGVAIRITLPSLSEERRNQLIKVLGEKKEEARIVLRQFRNDVLKEMRASEDIGKDEEFRKKGEAQKITDKMNEEIEKIYEQKEKEIKEV